MTDWANVLEDVERTLVEQRAALDRGDVQDITGYTPPAGLGPLPASLAGRARAALQESERLVQDLQAATASTQRELGLLDRMRPEAATPSFFDQAM